MNDDKQRTEEAEQTLVSESAPVTYWVQMNGAYSITSPDGYPPDSPGETMSNPSMFTWTMPRS